jgi:hypothetical protein
MGKKEVYRANLGAIVLVLSVFAEEKRRLEELSEEEVFERKADDWFRFHAEREIDHELDSCADRRDFSDFNGMLDVYSERWGKTEFYRDISYKRDEVKSYVDFCLKRERMVDSLLKQNMKEIPYDMIISNPVCGYLRSPKVCENGRIRGICGINDSLCFKDDQWMHSCRKYNKHVIDETTFSNFKDLKEYMVQNRLVA